MNLHLKLLCLFVKGKPFVMVDVDSVRIVRGIVAHVNVFIVVGASNFHEVIRYGGVVTAIRVPVRMRISSAQGLALPVEFAELLVMAMVLLTAVLRDSQSADHSVVLGQVAPIVMGQQVPNLHKDKTSGARNQ